MREFEGLYPQDFQKAWPQAYMLAVQHIAILQEHTGRQMDLATQQVLLAQRTAEKTTKELQAAKSDIVAAIESANAVHLASVTRLSDSLTEALAALTKKEKLFLDAVIIEITTIEQSRAQLSIEIKEFRNCPLWRRLWWAFRPKSISTK